MSDYEVSDRVVLAAQAYESDTTRVILNHACAIALAQELREQAEVVQGWREAADDEPDFRTFRDHLRARAEELDPAGTDGPDRRTSAD